jgi:hypothetical protein
VGFLDRLQGKKKVDPMAEVSAIAVAHLREQNLKFQRFMHDKVQELEERAALEQQRLPETGPDADFAGGDEFADYVTGSDEQPVVDDMKISLEESISLADVVELVDEEPDPLPAEAGVEPAESPSKPEEEAPVVDSPPHWENLFGLSGAGAAVVQTSTPAEALPAGTELLETVDEPVEAAVELPAAEWETEAEGPEAAMTVDAVAGPPGAGEVIEAGAQDGGAGGSLLWDWRSPPAEETGEDTGGGATVPILDPAREADDLDAKAETVIEEPDREDEGTPEEDFALLEDLEGQADGPEMPLPDDVGDWS